MHVYVYICVCICVFVLCFCNRSLKLITAQQLQSRNAFVAEVVAVCLRRVEKNLSLFFGISGYLFVLSFR